MSIFIKATLILVTIPFFLLSCFSHPIADDFCYANKVIELGFWKAQIAWYLEWSGRYFGTAVNSLYPALVVALGKDNYVTNFIGLYKFAPLFLLTIFFLSLFCFIKAIAGKISSNWNIFWITFLGFTIYLCTMPSTAEGFYWVNGAYNYTTGTIAFLFLFALLISSYQLLQSEKFYLKSIYVLSCSILAASVVGSSEVSAISLLIIVFWGVLLTSYIRHSSALSWKIILGVTAIATAMSFFSPGTLQRYSTIESEQKQVSSLLSMLINTGYDFIKTFSSWIINPTLLGASFLFIPVAIFLVKQISIHKHFKSKKLPIALYLIVWLSSVTAIFFMPYLSTGYLPDRVLNVSYFMFLIGWFLGIVVLIDFLGHPQLELLKVPKYINVFAQTILIISFLFNSNFGQASYDLLVNAPRYNSQLNKRYEIIRESIAQNQTNIKVPALKNPVPKTIYFPSDITNNSKHWSNECYAKLFKLDSIVTTKKR